MTNEKTRLDFIEKHAPRALCHYVHAKEKHPHFCDGLLPTQVPNPMTEDAMIREIRESLRENRLRLERGRRNANILWNELLNCEVWEATEAMANGDAAHAVEECYDAIAILLRTIDVLEGRQQLGKPETKGEAK